MVSPSRFASGWIVLALTNLSLAAARADQPIRIREALAVNDQYHVSVRVDLSGTLSLPALPGGKPSAPLAVQGTSVIDYDERILAASSAVERTARIYRRVDFSRRIGDRSQQQTIRPTVRRLIVLRMPEVEVPFSPDGPLTWGELDLIRTDVFTPALSGLYPDHAVAPGDRWHASDSAIRELTDLRRLEENHLECRLDQVSLIQGHRHARIALAGTARGVNEDGPNRHELDGYYFFDLDANRLSYLYLNGKSTLLGPEGKPTGTVEGRFVLTRQPNQARDLLDAADVRPNEDNTLLLHEDASIRFVYSRRWHIANVRGRQLAIDEARGSGMLLTLEPPSRIPTGAQFQSEVKNWLAGKNALVTREQTIQPVRVARGTAERFEIETTIDRQPVVLVYYTLRQAQGGVTVSARLKPGDAGALRADVEQIVRGLTITALPEPPAK